jgi:hypothetical protein
VNKYILPGLGIGAVVAAIGMTLSRKKAKEKELAAGGAVGPVGGGAPDVPRAPVFAGGGSTTSGKYDPNETIGNFKMKELVVSASHPSLVEPIPPEYMGNARKLISTVLQPMRSWIGQALYIDSGYRGPKLNAAVGGSDTSQHQTASAADVSTHDNTKNRALFLALMAGQVRGFAGGQVIYYPNRGNSYIHAALPGATHPAPMFYVNDPARGLSYKPVANQAEFTRLGY